MKRARKNNKKTNKLNKPINQTAPKKKKKVIKKIFTTLIVIILFFIIALLALLGFGFVSEEQLLAPIDRESGRVNVLVLGVDNDGLRTDTIIVASMDLKNSQLSLLSIPRDTKLYVKNKSMTRKITEIHAMSSGKNNGTIAGPVATAQAVTQLTGIPINYYVEFSFKSVYDIFKTLGKIEYEVPDVEGGGRGMNYEDPVQDLYIHLKPGLQELDADKILQFIRYRKGDSDFQRMERQQGIIKAVVDQKLNASLILKLPKLFTQLNKDINTDLSVADITKYAGYLLGFKGENIKTYQLPGESERLPNGWYFICDIEETKTLITEEFGYDTQNINTKIVIDTDDLSYKPFKMKDMQIGTPQSKTTQQTKSNVSKNKYSYKDQNLNRTNKTEQTENIQEETPSETEKSQNNDTLTNETKPENIIILD